MKFLHLTLASNQEASAPMHAFGVVLSKLETENTNFSANDLTFTIGDFTIAENQVLSMFDEGDAIIGSYDEFEAITSFEVFADSEQLN